MSKQKVLKALIRQESLTDTSYCGLPDVTWTENTRSIIQSCKGLPDKRLVACLAIEIYNTLSKSRSAEWTQCVSISQSIILGSSLEGEITGRDLLLPNVINYINILDKSSSLGDACKIALDAMTDSRFMVCRRDYLAASCIFLLHRGSLGLGLTKLGYRFNAVDLAPIVEALRARILNEDHTLCIPVQSSEMYRANKILHPSSPINTTILDTEHLGVGTIKCLTPSGIFLIKSIDSMREVTVLASLKHRNIIGLKGCTFDTMFLEYAPSNLRSWISTNSSTTWEDVFVRGRTFHTSLIKNELEKQILSAITYIHNRNIIHCDIRPDNILLTSDRTVKLANFNQSQVYADSIVVQQQSINEYSSPEIIDGSRYSISADVWSVGVTILELEIGVHPFISSKSLTDTIVSVVESGLPMIKSPDVRLMLLQMLAYKNRCTAKQAALML